MCAQNMPQPTHEIIIQLRNPLPTIRKVIWRAPYGLLVPPSSLAAARVMTITHPYAPWLVFALLSMHFSLGFVTIRAPPAAGAAPRVLEIDHAPSRSSDPPAPAASTAARHSLGQVRQRCELNVRQRRRYKSHVLSAEEEAAAEVDEVAFGSVIVRAPREPAVQAFEAWTAAAGCRDNSASLSHAEFHGLSGIMTTASVAPWKPIATVPVLLFLEEDLCYSKPAAAAAGADKRTTPLPPPAPLSVEAWRCCPWWVRLGVRLLDEWAAGLDSRFQEYVQMLPDPGETGTPVYWSAEQLDRLHYPRLRSQVKLQRRLLKGFRKFLLADATRGDNAASARADQKDRSNRLVEALGDSARFDWALECVLSRAFQLPPDDAVAVELEEDGDTPVKAPELTPPEPGATRMALLPLIDSINHYSRIPTHMYWEPDGALSLSVGASFDPGDHAFMSYGVVSNDDLLQYYGFVERDNPHDAYVLEGMGKWLREDGLLGADLSTRLLSSPGAREVWRYLRRGVILRDAVHPTTMQAVRVVVCEVEGVSDSGTLQDDGSSAGESKLRWDGTEADLSRFATPVSLASETAALELLMRYSAREADNWGEAGVAAALAEDPTVPDLDDDLDGLGLDADRRLMLSVFRQEKIALLRSIIGRLTHMRKVSNMLNRPIKLPVNTSPPSVLGAESRSQCRA